MAKPDLDELAGPDGGPEGYRLAKFWLDQINTVLDSSQMKHWLKRGETIVRRYRDERSRTDEEGHRHYNSLWANVEILKPALYGKTPLPVAERRFRDKDPQGRAAAQMLERALRNEIEICGFTDAVSRAVSDYLLPGRGIVWVRYEPEIEEGVSLPPETETDMKDVEGELPGRQTPPQDQEQTITAGGRRRPRILNNVYTAFHEEKESGEEAPEEAPEEEKLLSTGDRIIRESTPIDFIEWHDFFTFPIRARNWTEVTAVGKRIYMSRDQMKRRFGKEIGGKIPLQKDGRGDRTQNTTLQLADEDKGQVFEIWNKQDKSLYWVAIGYDHLCDRADDPLNLENFWPVPPPLYANSTNDTLIPVPDFIQYQDQALQIDELTQRIAMLTKACKMAGLYNAAAKDIQRIFNESVENELIPVDDWAAFAEKGGIEGNWSLMPVDVIKSVIQELMTVKQQAVEEMDRLTGINDIMRGTSDARETLGGVRLKANNTGTRLTQRQNEVARFARDVVRIMADIMCQHFSPKSIIEVSGALYEEGLGAEDMPPITAMQQGGPPPQNPNQPIGARPPPQLGPPQGQMQPPGAPPGPPPGAPGAPPGTNVVPFRPPGAAAPAQTNPQSAGQAPGAPGQPPVGPQGMPGQGMPPIDPQMQAKMAALQRIAGAIQLLRDERMRGFRVDIEVDSTIFADAAQEKADRTEFITRVTQFMGMAFQMGAQMPPAVPLLAKLLQFGVRGFRVGRDLELAIEQFGEEALVFAKQAQQNAQNQPNPEMMKAQTEQAKAQAQIQAIQLKTQSESKAADAEVQRQQLQNQGDQAQAQADIQSSQMDQQMKHMEMQIEQVRLQVEQIKAHAEMQIAGAKTQQAHAATEQAHAQTQATNVQAQAQVQQAHHQTAQTKEQSAQAHEQTAQEHEHTQQAAFDSKARIEEAHRPPEPKQAAAKPAAKPAAK